MKTVPESRITEPSSLSSPRYTPLAQQMHWITAVLVFALIAIAWSMQSMDQLNPRREFLFDVHKSLGLTVWLLVVARLIWRFRHPAPALRQGMPRWIKILSTMSHSFLYVLFFLMPISGFTTSSAGGHGVHFWGIPLPNLPHDEAIAKLGATAHVLGSYVVYALVSLHLFATAWHVFVRRDGILQRMLPQQVNRNRSGN